MNWLFPGLLAGSLAVAVPILLHLLRRRPRRTVVFPSLRFLATTSRRTEKQHRMQRWLVLALRCLAILLLAAAFARPFFGGEGGTGTRAVVVVIDNSFSLQANDRWETLRAWAVEHIGPLGNGDKLGLLLVGPRPTWLAAPSTDPAAALALLQRLEPGWESARAEPALRLAAETLAALPANERRLIFLGDHQRLSWLGMDFGKELPAGVTPVFPLPPERAQRQAAVLAPTLSRTEQGVRATIAVRNFSGAASRRLAVFSPGVTTPLFETTLELSEHETRQVEIDLPVGAEGRAAFRFTLDADDLAADDTAYAAGEWKATHTVLLDPVPVGSDADYVATALGSTATLAPTFRVAPATAPSWPTKAVVVLRNAQSFEGNAAARLDAFLQAGGAALVFIDGTAVQRKWFASRGLGLRPLQAGPTPWQVRDWSVEHPLVAALSEQRVTPLLGWNFRVGWGLPLDVVEPLALWSDGTAAIGELTVGEGRLLICGFAPDRRESEWPVHAAFVPFVHLAVAHLLGGNEGAVTKPVRVGEILVLPAETGRWRAIDGPLAGRADEPVPGTVIPDAPGLYEFSSGAEKSVFAVNLSAEESDLAAWDDGSPWLSLRSTTEPAPRSDAPRARVTLAAMEAEQRSPLWWPLLAVAAVLLMAELGLANRTMR